MRAMPKISEFLIYGKKTETLPVGGLVVKRCTPKNS